MAATEKLRGFLSCRKGDAAVAFIATAAMLILIVATLVSALVYVAQYYSASYICRRVVRTIEITGEYDEHLIRTMADELGGNSLDELNISVDASYCSGRKIQLRESFTVRLSAIYNIPILQLGAETIQLQLPIQIRLSGRSEVFWK